MGKDAVCECGDGLCKGSVGFHRGQDPALYDLYCKNLLQRGWAGNTDAEEQAYIKCNTTRSPKQRAADEQFRERMQALRMV